jgi:hypothetical protein
VEAAQLEARHVRVHTDPAELRRWIEDLARIARG